jgi:hypothetical protein
MPGGGAVNPRTLFPRIPGNPHSVTRAQRETGRRTIQQIVMVIYGKGGEAQIIRGILKKDGKIGKVDLEGHDSRVRRHRYEGSERKNGAGREI